MASVYFGHGSTVGHFLKEVENALASAGTAYAGKIAIGRVTAVLAGHEYAYPTNLRDIAVLGGVFYLAQVVTRHVFDNIFKETNAGEGAVAKVITAAKLTTLAAIPLSIDVIFHSVFLLFPATYVGTKLADKFRDAITPAKP